MRQIPLKRFVRLVDDRRFFDPETDRYLGLEHIRSWTGEIVEAEDAKPEGLVGVFRSGDILFGKLRPYLAKVATPDFGGVCSTEALILRPEPDADGAFLRYVLSSEEFIGRVNAATFGVKMPRASWQNVGAELVPAPSLKEQRRIAAFLDRETERVDALIDGKARFLRLAEEEWRSFLDARLFPSGDWARLPNDVQRVPLKRLVDVQRPITYGIVLPGPNMPDGPMIVKGGDVKPGRLHPDLLCRTTPEIEAAYARSRLRAGDLVISIRGSIGEVEIVPAEIDGANLTQDAARIAPAAGVSREWLRYALLAPRVFHPLEAKSLGAAVRGINIFDLKNVMIPTPSSETQRHIALEATRHEERIEQLRGLVRRHASLLREHRAALITAAVTGQIDPESWRRSGAGDRALHRIEARFDGAFPDRIPA